jgi:hypothetical protein
MRQIPFVVCIILFTAICLVSPALGLSEDDRFSFPIGAVNITATIPDSPSYTMAYQVTAVRMT